MSYKYVLITFLGSLIILGLLSNRLNYREGLTDPPPAAKVDSAKPGDSPPPPSPGNRPYEFDPKLVEAAAKAWDEKEKKKWAKKRADEAKNKLNRYNSDNKRMDDLKKARKTARLAREEKDVNFVEEQQAQAKNRIKKHEPPLPPPSQDKKNSCEFFHCEDGYRPKSETVTEEQVKAAIDAARHAEEAVAIYKKNADLAAASSLVGPDCTKTWASETAELYAAAVEELAKAKIEVETIKKKAIFPALCVGGVCTKDECCEKIPGHKDHKPGCGCSSCVAGPIDTDVDMAAGPFVRNFFEGTEVNITPSGLDPGHKSKRGRHYSDYHDSYKKTVHHYPDESIRFDLLTPVPYSDAMAAPMGPRPRRNPKLPNPSLEQVSFRDRQINNID